MMVHDNNDARLRTLEAEGHRLADRLREQGGECDCGERGLFTVKLTDGRVFTKTAIHGSGGVWRLGNGCPNDFPSLLKGVLAFVDRKRSSTEFRNVVIYLAERYWGAISMTVTPEEIESIS